MSQEPSAMLLYGYELPGSAVDRVRAVSGVHHVEAQHIMNYLYECRRPWYSVIHVEKHQTDPRERFFLGADNSFVCASGWGVHEVDEAPESTATDHDLVNAMKALGVVNPSNPKWLMVVDFS